MPRNIRYVAIHQHEDELRFVPMEAVVEGIAELIDDVRNNRHIRPAKPLWSAFCCACLVILWGAAIYYLGSRFVTLPKGSLRLLICGVILFTPGIYLLTRRHLINLLEEADAENYIYPD